VQQSHFARRIQLVHHPKAGATGVVFKLDSTGKESVLHSFAGAPTDGAKPFAGLVRDLAGNLYGTTSTGGASNNRSVFKLDSTGKETVLYSFVERESALLFPPVSAVSERVQERLLGSLELAGVFLQLAGILNEPHHKFYAILD
jgi:uncharacterized repeat protein (TIGR03803 family)